VAGTRRLELQTSTVSKGSFASNVSIDHHVRSAVHTCVGNFASRATLNPSR